MRIISMDLPDGSHIKLNVDMVRQFARWPSETPGIIVRHHWRIIAESSEEEFRSAKGNYAGEVYRYCYRAEVAD